MNWVANATLGGISHFDDNGVPVTVVNGNTIESFDFTGLSNPPGLGPLSF